MPLSADRKAQFEEAFEIIGKKATEIERMDVGIIMRSLGQNPTNDEVKELFEKVAGGESSIPLEKMLKVADEFETRMKASDQTTVLKEAFAVFDKDNSGSISAAELRHVIANLDESVDEDETDEMMKMADADGARARGWVTHTSHTANRSLSLSAHTPFARTGDGIINYNEFVQVLLGSANGIPPPVKIPDDLIPYMNAIKDKKK